MRYLSILLLLLPFWVSAAVDYQISITEPDQHLADITIKMDVDKA